MGRLIFSDDGSHGGAEARRSIPPLQPLAPFLQFRHLSQFRHQVNTVISVISVASVISATSGSPAAQTIPDCGPRDTAVIAARERAAAEWPKALLPQIELAVCYDKAWRFLDVEPAIAKAVTILDAEISSYTWLYFQRKQASAPPVAASGGSRPIARSNVPEPRRRRDEQADYPPKALLDGITGSVIVELVIDPKGNVREARAVKSVPELDEAAVKAARKWKYEPTLVGGKATEVLSYALVRFGQTTEPIPADWLAMAAFHYEKGHLWLARTSLDAAIAKTRDDRKRFDGYVPGETPGSRGGMTAPVKTKDVRPSYPADALSSRVQGTVLIEALVETSGRIGRAHVVSKPSVLDAAALNAVLQWEFTPATRNGTPIATSMTSMVSFRIGR